MSDMQCRCLNFDGKCHNCGRKPDVKEKLTTETNVQKMHNAWQPIETAPKDGTRILVYNGKGGGYCTYDGDIGVAAWEITMGKKQWGSQACCDGVSYFTPTHWMPQPKPPEDK